LRSGALALGGAISANPVLVGGSTAFLVTLFYVSANALWYQPYPHKGAFFATRTIEHFADAMADEPETTINIERPAPVPAPVRPDPVVLKVQGVLKELGFYPGTVDGISGPATHKAVEAYRHKVGLAGGDTIDAVLLDQLGAVPTTGAVVPSPAPRGNAGDGASDGAGDRTGDRARPAPAAPNADARIVKIQAGLKAFGNDDIKLDGVIGARTKAAIKEFQSLFGLPETGEPDEVVYAKMREIGLTD
jgi:peptidoglycan hydrolase-like protein with peptidoglycan-binding domain